MDYATVQHDGSPDENQAETSPWASSPQPNRTFKSNPIENQPPPSPGPLRQSPHLGSSSVSTDYKSRDTHISQNGHTEQSDISYTQSADHHIHRQNHPPLHEQYGNAQRPHQERYHSRNRPTSRGSSQYRLQAKITGLERPGRKDPILSFDVYTNLPGYRTTQFRDVRRTHSEFQKLADHLVSSNPEAIVPALPLSATPAGVGTDEDEARVKVNIQRWMNIVCGNEVLMRDDEMVRFIEGDPGYSPVMRKSQPATGVRRKVLKQFAPPIDDTPELQDARPIVKRFYLGTMDAGQKVDRVVKARRGIGLAENDLGAKLGAMTDQEMHPGLKNAYRRLGKTIQTVGDLHAVQATAEATTFADPLHYHSADAFIVKETLTNRHILLRELIQAQQATRSKLSATDRLKASTSVRRDKVDEAISALDEARSHESYLAQKTQNVTTNLVQERRKWFARTAADLKASLREYVVREIEAERRALATLEAVRPDIRAIDSSGGLSRLGREATPAARRATVQSSQGPKGDAWSGVPRNSDGLNRTISGSFVGLVPEPETAEGDADGQLGRKRAVSGAGSLQSVQEDDEDRIDARNAASRLAASTF